MIVMNKIELPNDFLDKNSEKKKNIIFPMTKNHSRNLLFNNEPKIKASIEK